MPRWRLCRISSFDYLGVTPQLLINGIEAHPTIGMAHSIAATRRTSISRLNLHRTEPCRRYGLLVIAGRRPSACEKF